MMKEKLATSLFDLRHTLCAPFLEVLYNPWELLADMDQLLLRISASLPADFREIAPRVWVGDGTDITPTALLQGPAIIGRNCQIRHGAFIREFVLIGDGTVIGNSTEIKNAVLFDSVQVPHFNYIGDAILGYKAHLGAGAVISNFKATGDEIWATLPNGNRQNTGRNKFGALIGDHVEIGCNAVIFPGTIIGKAAVVYPLCPARGYIPAGHILKNDGRLYPKSMK